MTTEDSTTIQVAHKFLDSVKRLLSEKNKKYGDAAANPIRVFSKASPVEQVLVRIDDKLSRLKNMGVGDTVDEDTIADLVGYLAILWALKNQS